MNNEQLKAGLQAALEGIEEVSQEALDKIVEGLRKEATEFLGPQTFVKGFLDRDNGGVLLRVKQPSAKLRLEAFVEAKIEPLPRSEEVDDEAPVETKAQKKKREKAEAKAAEEAETARVAEEERVAAEAKAAEEEAVRVAAEGGGDTPPEE